MRYRLILLVVVLGGILCFGRSYGQGAYDSSCYFPEMGNPNELDTIYGGVAEQSLGAALSHLPPLQEQQFDRLVMEGLPDNIPFLTAVETGPNFNLHKLKFVKKYPFIFANWPSIILGHFHNTQHTDILAFDNSGGTQSNAAIYWADDNGEYDTSRFTKVFPFNNRHMPYPYVAKLTSDSVDDIVMSINALDWSKPGDTSFIALIRGGQPLYEKGKSASWDDTVFWGHTPFGRNIDTLYRGTSQGDWRGVGREDLIVYDKWSNIYYYKNDPPFDLHNLVNAMRNDTLLKPSEWSLYNGTLTGNISAVPIRAFPKAAWDKSVDLLVRLPIAASTDPSHEGICFYKGGEHFGNSHLFLDSSNFFFHSPAYYSSDFSKTNWFGTVTDCGDLTKTGNPVMAIRGGYFTYGYTAFYVLGKALDDKIDAFFSQDGGGYGGADTIHISSDGRPSYIMGAPAYESPEDQANGIFAKGSLQLLRGNEKIPVRLNPKFAVTEITSVENSEEHIVAYPNPCQQSTVLTFDNCTGGKMTVDVINTNGEICKHEETPGGYGMQQYGLSLNDLSAGNYLVRLACLSDGWSTTTHIIKTGSAQTPWSFDLKKMVGR